MGRNYSRKESPTLADLSLIWDSANSDWRLSTFSSIKSLFDTTDTGEAVPLVEPNSQYFAPSATDFSVDITDNNEDTHLILTPLAGYADGTIVLPAHTSLRDKQTVLVNSTQAVTALAITGNGATVTGAPTTLAANGYFKLKYDLTVNTWYRVG